MDSRLGRIQRAIGRAFAAAPRAELRTIDLAVWAYPRVRDLQQHHRKSIVRAAKKVAVRVRRDRPGGVVFVAKESQSLPRKSKSSKRKQFNDSEQ